MVSMDGIVRELGIMKTSKRSSERPEGRKRPVRRVKNMRCAVCGSVPPQEILCYVNQLKWMLEHRDKRHKGIEGYALALYTDEDTKEAVLICCDLEEGDYEAFLKELKKKAKEKEV